MRRVFWPVLFALLAVTVVAVAEQVTGLVAAGSAVGGNPVLVGGSDGTNVRNLSVDTSGRLAATGGAANGAAVAGNPVLVAGSDGTNVRTLNATPGGNAAGATVNTAIVGGSDGTNAQPLSMTATGRNLNVDIRSGTSSLTNSSGVFCQGTAANGNPVVGSPVMIAGWDGASVRNVGVVPQGSTFGATANLVQVGTQDNAATPATRALRSDVTFFLATAAQTRYTREAPIASGVLTSNGTTNVAIVAAGGAGIVNYCIKLTANNTSGTVVHTFDLKSGTTILGRWLIGANGSLTLDSEGAYQTAAATAMNFAIDSGGTGTDVTVTALTIAK